MSCSTNDRLQSPHESIQTSTGHHTYTQPPYSGGIWNTETENEATQSPQSLGHDSKSKEPEARLANYMHISRSKYEIIEYAFNFRKTASRMYMRSYSVVFTNN